MASYRVRDLKTLLDRLAEEAEFDEDPTAEEETLRREAISAFIAGGAQLLEEATPFLRAYYQRTAAEFTPEQRAQYGIPDIPGALQYDRAVLAGRDVSAPVRVTYFFGLESPGARPVAAEDALSVMGITDVIVDEEISGDGWWHVAAFPMLRLTPEAIVGAKRLMMRLAAATGIRYDGWHVTLNAGEEQQLASRRPELAHVTDHLPSA